MAKVVTDNQEQDLAEDSGMGGTPAADTLHTHYTPKSKMMADTLVTLSSMPHDDLTAWFHKAIENSAHYADAIDGGRSESNKSTIAMKPSNASDANLHKALPAVTVVKEDLDALFGGDNGLPEELRERVSTLFESAVNVKLAIEKAKVEESFEEKFEQLNEDLIERLDEYLDYAASEWMTENKLAVENSIHVQLVNDFMEALKACFTEHYIEVPAERIDVVEELSKQVDDLQNKLDVETSKRLEIEKINQAQTATGIFNTVAEGLADTQVEKLMTLVEGVEFDGDEELFQEKLTTIRDAHFKAITKKPARGVLSEEVARTAEEWQEIDETDAKADAKPKSDNPQIARYLEVIENQAQRGRRGALR